VGKCLYMDVDFDGHLIGNKHFWIRWCKVKEAGGKYVTMQETENLMSSYSRYYKHCFPCHQYRPLVKFHVPVQTQHHSVVSK
jgi:hypothetical protein